jgi:trimethylamine--corrinoid protein Co-methyltransferase
MNGITVSKPLRLLDNDEMQRIHETSIQVLSKVGVVYEAEWALNILKEAGCEVDYKKQIAKIPEELVKDAINKSQRIIKLCGRNRKIRPYT